MTERDEEQTHGITHTAFQTKVNIVKDSLWIDVLMQNSNHVMCINNTSTEWQQQQQQISNTTNVQNFKRHKQFTWI